ALREINRTKLLTGDEIGRPDSIENDWKVRAKSLRFRELLPVLAKARLEKDVELRSPDDVDRNISRMRIEMVQFVTCAFRPRQVSVISKHHSVLGGNVVPRRNHREYRNAELLRGRRDGRLLKLKRTCGYKKVAPKIFETPKSLVAAL